MAKNEPFRKFEIDHLKDRIRSTTRCVNGNIETICEEKTKSVELTVEQKFDMILKKTAKLKPVKQLESIETEYRYEKLKSVLVQCYDYKLPKVLKENETFNKNLNEKKEELLKQVELAGKRIIDDVLFGIIKLEEVTDRIEELSSFSEIAKKF